MPPTPDDGWIEWKNHVLTELKRLNRSVEHYRDKQQAILIEVAELRRISASLEKYRKDQELLLVDVAKAKVYIGMISALAALVTSAVVTVLFQYLMKM